MHDRLLGVGGHGAGGVSSSVPPVAQDVGQRLMEHAVHGGVVVVVGDEVGRPAGCPAARRCPRRRTAEGSGPGPYRSGSSATALATTGQIWFHGSPRPKENARARIRCTARSRSASRDARCASHCGRPRPRPADHGAPRGLARINRAETTASYTAASRVTRNDFGASAASALATACVARGPASGYGLAGVGQDAAAYPTRSSGSHHGGSSTLSRRPAVASGQLANPAASPGAARGSGPDPVSGPRAAAAVPGARAARQLASTSVVRSRGLADSSTASTTTVTGSWRPQPLLHGRDVPIAGHRPAPAGRAPRGRRSARPESHPAADPWPAVPHPRTPAGAAPAAGSPPPARRRRPEPRVGQGHQPGERRGLSSPRPAGHHQGARGPGGGLDHRAINATRPENSHPGPVSSAAPGPWTPVRGQVLGP